MRLFGSRIPVDDESRVAARARIFRLTGLGGARPVGYVGGWVPRRRDVEHEPAEPAVPAEPGALAAPGRQATAATMGGPGGALEDRLPLWLRARLRPRVPAEGESGVTLRRPHAAVVVTALVLAIVAAAGVFLVGRPRTVPVEAEPVAAGTPLDVSGSPGGDIPVTDGASVVVHVAGRVKTPGVVTLPAGTRVVDAIEAAGGAQDGVDLGTLNLARVLDDGEQLLVGVEPPPQTPGGGGGGGSGGGGGAESSLVDLNTATLEELDTLPGIGPALAQRILDWRSENGRFSAVDELREVSGIGETKFADLVDQVTV